MAAANDERVDMRVLADIQCAYALGTMHLVGADGEHVATKTLYVEGDLARSLYGVDVEENARLSSNTSNIFNRLQNAGLVVGQHHADQPGVGP